MNNNINDKPFRSRKFFLTVFCILLLTVVCILGIWFPMLPAILPTFVGGILGILSLYFTGNVLQKHINKPYPTYSSNTSSYQTEDATETQTRSSSPASYQEPLVLKPENPDEEGEI